jgi:N-acetylglucosamine-6-phosphate deacetylase
MMRRAILPSRLFDGTRMQAGAVILDGARIEAMVPEVPEGMPVERVEGVLAPAFVDLQVNGGGGVMVDGATDLPALRHICAAHRRLGTGGILPTLITDTPQATVAVIDAGVKAAEAGVPGFLGLHLEGPHLDPRRKGAHDPSLIRPMTAEDLARLCEAAQRLPALMVTLAPEAATPEQIAALASAGAVVSLGHSDCTHEVGEAAFRAGARCATHLFNAMSQIGNRAPGLAGAVLAGDAAAGIIADGIHVHPSVLRIALAARPEGIFLVSDCMAFAGTDLTELTLNGRRVLRQGGRLTLADGTLAGADLTLAQAVRVLVDQVGVPLERALAMATSIPADLMEVRAGRIAPGAAADLVLLSQALEVQAIWLDGARA